MPESSATSPQSPRPHSLGKEVLSLVLAVAVGGLLSFGAFRYWRYAGTHPSTDDAYLQAHYVWISPQVSGQVVALFVHDNQPVKAGDRLFQIDPRPFDAALVQAKSELELVTQQIEVDKAAVEAASAKVDEQRANLDNAKANFERVSKLVKRGDESKLHGIGVEDAYRAAEATLKDYQAELELAREQLGPPPIQQARIDKARAAVDLAQLNRDWTLVTAPADGWVSRLALRVGDVVQPGDNLFPFVESAIWWVEANFKETQIAAIEPGMPVSVSIDAYTDRTFDGVVESLDRASAASFSLLPAQNTTGNWVKVTQRMPVRISMAPMDQTAPYRMGASVTATVITDAPETGPEGKRLGMDNTGQAPR